MRLLRKLIRVLFKMKGVGNFAVVKPVNVCKVGGLGQVGRVGV
jgi:hypothetical protein